jgi:hypothetical protein
MVVFSCAENEDLGLGVSFSYFQGSGISIFSLVTIGGRLLLLNLKYKYYLKLLILL